MQIYRTKNLVNGKWYIGKDALSRQYYLGSGVLLKLAIKKYGKHNFQKDILEKCSSLNELALREMHWIETTNAVTDKMSYNIATGGTGGNWTGGYTAREVKEIYDKRGYQGDYCSAAQSAINSMSQEEKATLYKRQATARSQTWLVSHAGSEEVKITNLKAWCRENGIDSGQASAIANPNSRLYGKLAKGWRIRKEGDPELPIYVNNRKTSRSHPACKGKTWKLVDGKRVWFDKE
jgi:hypothetical protein